MAYAEHAISSKDEYLTSGMTGTSGNPTPNRQDHWGADFVSARNGKGDPMHSQGGVDIIAIADGEVSEYTNGRLVGHTIGICHAGKIFSRYQHMRAGSVLVRKGQKVAKGQAIGVMGNTGNCSTYRTDLSPEYLGTHLHLGVKENSTAFDNGKWVNPLLYMNGTRKIAGLGVVLPTAPASPVAPAPVTGFEPGQKVMVLPTIDKYANGKFVPGWVRGYVDEVIQVKQNQVLTKQIYTWLWEADVVKV